MRLAHGRARRADPHDPEGSPRLSDAPNEAVREVAIPNEEGLHARPVMRFVDLASKFKSTVTVANVSRNDETVDGKSAMQMMLLEATQGCVLKIIACGEDARDAVDALAGLVEAGFKLDALHQPE